MEIYWYDGAENYLSSSYVDLAPASVGASYVLRTLTATAPTGAVLATFYIWSLLNASPVGQWYVDDCFSYRSSSIIVQGTPGGARVEINAGEIAGYSDATTKQFYLQSSDGKAYAGAGAVVLDSGGIKVTGKFITLLTGGVAKGYLWADATGDINFEATQDFIVGVAGGIELAATATLGINSNIVATLLGNNFIITSLPAANPTVAGALWNDGGTVKVSAG